MSHYKNNGAQKTPRRPIIQPSATSPFSTSPSQLLEVTLDSDATANHAAGGFHSPNGGPMRGRSIKEFEESLTSLRKENFNLKLRIYFLEERMGTNFCVDKENAVKKNIELKVEVESLKKELCEKQELLCQAVKAMELDEEEHKKVSEEQLKKISNLQNQLETLQQKFEDEMHCQGDHGFEEDKEYYEQAFNMHGKECGHESYIQELETKIKDLEIALEKSKDTTRELENLLQLTDNRSSNVTALEEELKQKDNTIKKLQVDIEERTKVVSNYRVRVNNLEDDLIEKKNDIDFIAKELKEKCLLVQELKHENEGLQKLLNETQSNLSLERRKNEKHKLSVHDRNKRIMELEDEVNQLTKKMAVVQSQFESAVKTEVQRKHDEARKPQPPHTDLNKFSVRESSKGNVTCGDEHVYSPRPSSLPQLRLSASPSSPIYDRHRNQLKSRSPAESSSANTVGQYSSELKELDLEQLQREIVNSKKHIMKLEQDQLRACKVIQCMLETRKENSREIDELKSAIVKKDNEIDQLSEKISKYYKDAHDLSMVDSLSSQLLSPTQSKKSLHTRITEVSLTPSVEVGANNETSAADLIEDPKLLLEQYKELTDNLEEQKQVLVCTLEETKNQLQDLEGKCETLKTELKARENRIVDLEFELLSLSQGISSESLGMGEKLDVGNEKPASFFIKEIEEKDREIEKLESELKKRTGDLQAIVNKELWEKNREIEKLTKRYNEIIAIKDRELMQMEGNLSAKNQQLEVLKERISELGIIVRHCDNSIEVIQKESQEILMLETKLNDCIKEREFYKTQLVEFDDKLKLAAEKAIIDFEKLSRLENELKKARDETEKCESLRQDAVEVCSVLCRRLEELAYFLDSLLKQKSVLGHLGLKKNVKLQQLVNQSLDISRTLSLSMTINSNQSLMQLSNISALLNTSLAEDFIEEEGDVSTMPIDDSLTYQSHFCQTEQLADEAGIIAALRTQIENLKKEIEARDIELGKIEVIERNENQIKKLSVVKLEEISKEDEEIMDVLLAIVPESQGVTPSSQQQIYETLVCTKVNLSGDKAKYGIDINSESESWSEPDRAVSKARIGLGDCLSAKQSNEAVGSTEEDPEKSNSLTRMVSRKSILAENRQTIINLHEQICELETKLKDKETEFDMLKDAFSQLTLQLETERKMSHEIQKQDQERNEELKRERDELLAKIADAEKKLEAAEMAKQETQSQLKELQDTIEEVKTSQKILQETVDIKNKDAQNKMNELELEKGHLIEKLKQVEQSAEVTRIDCAAAEKKLKLLREEIQFLEHNIRQEVQMEWEEKFTSQDQNYEIKIKFLEHAAEAELKMIREDADIKIRRITEEADEQIKQLVEENQDLLHKYEAECVKRVEVDKVMGTIKELEKFKKVVKVAEERIYAFEENEKKLKQQLQECENEYQIKVNMLHEELEKANLTYSESLLEKTRILTEKAELDFRLKQFSEKEIEFARQVSEYKDEFANMKDSFQKQLAHLENQKSRLELRIGELEQANAELKNRIVKLQAADSQMHSKLSSSPTSSRILELFLNKTVPANYKRQQSDNSENSDEHSSCGARTMFHVPVVAGPIDLERQHANSSPDLGIESDHGRFSSLEATVNLSRPFLKTLELTESMSNLLTKEDAQIVSCSNEQCCMKTKELANENNDLRKRLLRTRRALEDTANQLTMANQRKKQVEKTICKQIHKTSQVLRKAKANLDNGSDQDVLK